MTRTTKVFAGSLLLAAGAYAVATLAGPQGLPALRQKRASVEKLQDDNERLRQQIDARRERIRRLRESQDELEMEIRRRLKYLKPGETYLVLPPERKPAEPEKP